jgi:4-hydroxybenzoate polyprenyltransferase
MALDPSVPDAHPGNWVDRIAPSTWRPYLRLARFDRPIGAWLLLFPCWWGQGLAELSLAHPYPSLKYLALFFVGAFLMRGAGCTWNDMVDKDFDLRVARTAARPLPSGQVSVAQAQIFLVLLLGAGLLILVQFNVFTIALGASSLILVAVYPFMKRLTDWPQVVLGLAFKWGALLGWSAIAGALSPCPLALYAGCVLWTIGYDTIYAHQDKDDDLSLGLKSTALKLAASTPRWLVGFYGGAVLLWGAAGALAGAHLPFFLALALCAVQLAWQVATLKVADPANCLARFKSNQLVGWLLFGGLLADMALLALVGASAGAQPPTRFSGRPAAPSWA